MKARAPGAVSLTTTERITPSPRGSWSISSGSGNTSANGGWQYSYADEDGYSIAQSGGATTGGYGYGGYRDVSYAANTSATWSASGWTTTGTSEQHDEGNSIYSYSEDTPYTDSQSSSAEGWTSGGSISASEGIRGHEAYAWNYTANYALGASGQWEATSGSGFEVGGGSTHYGYSASGGYWSNGSGGGQSGDMGGEFEETLDVGSSYAFGITADCAGGVWSYSGTGGARDNGGSHYWSSASGTYSDSDSGWSKNGSFGTSDGGDSSYDSSIEYALDEMGVWQTTDGSGDSSANGFTQQWYEAGGTYPFGESTGTFTEDGSEHSSYEYATSALYSGGGWSLAGWGTESAGGNAGYSYSASGGFSGLMRVSDYYSGTKEDGGGSQDTYGYTTDYELDSEGNWRTTGGSATAAGGAQSYSRAAGSGTGTFEGHANASFTYGYDDTASYSYGVSSTFSGRRWETSGTGSANVNRNNGYDWSAESSYSGASADWPDYHITDGTYESNGGDHDSSHYETDYAMGNDGRWYVDQCSGTISEISSSGYAYSGTAESGAGSEDGNGNYSINHSWNYCLGSGGWRVAGGNDSVIHTHGDSFSMLCRHQCCGA